MGFIVWQVVFVGSLCALFVLVVLQRWLRSKGPKQSASDTTSDDILEPKHKVFLSHSGAQKNFVEQLCVDLERCDRYPFFDKRRRSLPIGENFPTLIFQAIEQCEVGVVVLSEEFFIRSKWPMLELVAMTKNLKLVIIPVFLGVLLKQVQDPKHQRRWKSIWHGWKQKDKRINIDEWFGALKALGPINSLVYDGTSEVSFREQIVQAVCDVVPPETRWKDFHIKGKSRLCKVIREKIDATSVSKKHGGACMVGLFGVGGIGKTTICQALCNEYFGKMRGRVCHVELGSASNKLELLRRTLKSLTDKNDEVLLGLDSSQCEDLLKTEIGKQAIFLAIDNVSDSFNSIELAKTFLSTSFKHGSIILVTSRSLEVLKLRPLNIDESNCLEMPELEEDEAKLLFVEHAIYDDEARKEVDDVIIGSCLKRCYFQKGDGKSYHYHPLALKVLGTQLGYTEYNPIKWREQLQELDTFNHQREEEHPIFSILMKSFDTLKPEDRLLFMDVALFLPQPRGTSIRSVYEWLSMVHGVTVRDMMKRLEGLNRKSILELEDLGVGHSRIGIHDLWREFAVMETTAGEFESRRWVYEVEESSALEESTPAGGFWQNVKRMCFRGNGLMTVRRINLDHFSNITVMKLVSNVKPPVNLTLDVKCVKHLKSLEIEFESYYEIEVHQLSSVENLRFLQLGNAQVPAACIDDIGILTNLRVLALTGFQGASLPDLGKLISLQEVNFSGCCKVVNISGISSRLSKLRVLVLDDCSELRSLGPGVGDLDALQELSLRRCVNLDELPDLQNLTNFRKLDIGYCNRIKSLPGLGELVAVQELWAWHCSGLAELPDMSKLTNLRVLRLTGCPLQSAPGMDGLTALQELEADFTELHHRPDLRMLSLLRKLHITGCSSAQLRSVASFSMLEMLIVTDCTLFDEVPDLQGLKRLEILQLGQCDVKDLSSLSGLSALWNLYLSDCGSLERLPDMHKLTRLNTFTISKCEVLRDVLGTRGLSQLETLHFWQVRSLREMPDLSNFPQLKRFVLGGFPNVTELVRLTSTGPLDALESFNLEEIRSLISLPDLSNFPALEILSVLCCESLIEISCAETLTALEGADLDGCRSLKAIPDLSNFPQLVRLTLSGCSSLGELTCTGPLTALEYLNLAGCRDLNALPDLSNFPHLVSLNLRDCESLMELTCTELLVALEELNLGNCRTLKAVPGLSNFPHLNLSKYTPQPAHDE